MAMKVPPWHHCRATRLQSPCVSGLLVFRLMGSRMIGRWKYINHQPTIIHHHPSSILVIIISNYQSWIVIVITDCFQKKYVCSMTPTDERERPSLTTWQPFPLPCPNSARRSRWKIQELAWSFSEVRYAHHGVFHTLLRGLQVAGWLVTRNYSFSKHPNKNHTMWWSCNLYLSLTDVEFLGCTAECQHVGFKPGCSIGPRISPMWDPLLRVLLVSLHCLKNEWHHGFILRCLINMPTSQRGSGPIFPRIHGMGLASFFPR